MFTYYVLYLLRWSHEIQLLLFSSIQEGERKKKLNVIITMNNTSMENIHVKKHSSKTGNEKFFSCEASKYKSRGYKIF